MRGNTVFGNSSIGAVRGPDQRNFDISLIKHIRLRSSRENPNLEFRAEFFNAFNTPQFSDPDTSAGTVGPNPLAGAPGQPNVILSTSPTFGKILSTSVNPRIIQLALKLVF